jgi:hypothetical protein
MMAVFGKSHLNFFQFTIFVTVYAAIVSKPLSNLLIKRCMLPDYIARKKKKR